MAYYEIYRERLAAAHATFGYPLWKPGPDAEYGPVRIGDVGHVHEGKFHRLFNALLPSGDPSHQGIPLPEYYEPLSLNRPHIFTHALNSNNFCSDGVKDLRAELEHLATGPPEHLRFSYSCEDKRGGAVLSLPVHAMGQSTRVPLHFGKWMLQHIDSWFSFARKEGRKIDHMEDIILVTGCHHTRTWANVVFLESQQDASFGIKMIQDRQADDVNIEWEFSLANAHGAVWSWGPQGRLKKLQENQCVFIQGFRVRRTLGIFPKQLRAAAGPNPSLDEDQDDEPDEELGSIPASTKTQDPLQVLIDYIDERSPNCDMVLVHDDDLARIARWRGSGESLQPEALMAYLQQAQPEIHQIRCSLPPTSEHGSSTRPTTVSTLMKEFHEWSERHDHNLPSLSDDGSETGALDHGRRSTSPSSPHLGRSVSPGPDFKRRRIGPKSPNVPAVLHEGASSRTTHQSPLWPRPFIPDFHLGRSVSPGPDFKQLHIGSTSLHPDAVPVEGASPELMHPSPLLPPTPDLVQRSTFQNEPAHVLPGPSQSQSDQPSSLVDTQCPVCGRNFRRPQERNRHVLTYLPYWIFCPSHSCDWRGDRYDNLKKHWAMMHQDFSPFPRLEDCKIYDPDTFVQSIVSGQSSIEEVTSLALAEVESRVQEIDKLDVWTDGWGRRQKGVEK